MKIPRIGSKVTLSNHPLAQVYTVDEVLSITKMSNKSIGLLAGLTYIEDGEVRSAGHTDVQSLLTPTDEQLMYAAQEENSNALR